MNKIYSISIETPFGNKKGTLILNISDTKVSGKLQSSSAVSTFYDGTLVNSNLTFSGKIKSYLFSIEYKVNALLKNNIIKGTATTNYGTFKFSGYLVS